VNKEIRNCLPIQNIRCYVQEEKGWFFAVRRNRSIGVENMLVRALYPAPQLLVAVKPNERVAHAVPVFEIGDLAPEPGLDFVHEFVLRHPWMHPDGDEVVCNAIEDLDLDKRSLRVGGGDGGGVNVGYRP